jgi:hypothetical protein
MTAAMGAGAAWFGPIAQIRADTECAGETSGHGALAAFCSDLRCPLAIAEACLRVLPPSEGSTGHLARLILADLSTTDCGDCTSVAALRRAVKERSQDDFSHGRIVYVEGWMLSLTETRVYALGALLAKKHPAGPNQS